MGVFFIIALVALFSLRYLPHQEIQVKTGEAALRDISQSISYAGSIESSNRVKIGSEIAGRVSAVFFEELADVSEGQILIKLEDGAIKAQLNQAKEALNQARINLVNAKTNLERVEKLFQKGFASKEQLEGAKQAFDVSSALVKQNQSNYEAIGVQLEYTSIRAPMSGTVISKNVSAGEIVAGPLGGGGLAMPTPIAEIADISDLHVVVDVDEVDIGKIKLGQEAVIAVDALPDKTFKGMVAEIALMTSGRREVGITYRVKVRLGSPEKMLKLGMTANADFIIRSGRQVLSVPKSALVVQGDKKYVFAVHDLKLDRREVATGIEGEEFIEVTSGLTPGKRVVIGIKTETGEGGGILQFGQEIIPDDILKLETGQPVVIIP